MNSTAHNLTSATVSVTVAGGLSIRTVRTAIKPFATGTAMFNYARKHNAGTFSTIVKWSNGRAVVTQVVQVGEHYEGRS
jgi:hypothetical protein